MAESTPTVSMVLNSYNQRRLIRDAIEALWRKREVIWSCSPSTTARLTIRLRSHAANAGKAISATSRRRLRAFDCCGCIR
jgi:hypothetical protein